MTLTATKQEQMHESAADLTANPELELARSGTNRVEERQELRKEMDEEELRKEARTEIFPWSQCAREVTPGPATGSLRATLRKALGADDEAIDVPTTRAEKMAQEHLRLAKTYLDAEGHEPDPADPADQEYWKAWQKIFEQGTTP
jgi:hypothetical protein